MQTNHPSLCIVVLYYNTFDLTRRCIESCLSSSYPNKHIVLVDNNSTIEPLDSLCSFFNLQHIVRLPSNLGFSAGVNAGIAYALRTLSPDYIAVVNSDLTLDENCLENSINELDTLSEYLPVAAVTGKIMFDHPYSNLIWQAGGHINNFSASGVPYGFKNSDSPSFNTGKLTGWASGAYSVFPSSIFSDIGFYDESYFFGQEEWDFSTRLLDAGFLIYYSPRSLSWHKVGGSYKGHNPVLNTYNGYINKVIYARRWIKLFPLWWLIFAVRTILFLPFILRVNCFHPSDIFPQTKAIILALINSLFITKVSGPHLTSIAKLIGTSYSFPIIWKADPTP